MNRGATPSAFVDTELERCSREGIAVVLATVVNGPWSGNRLLVWPGGQSLGDLGAPRLNQRVALFAEGLLGRGGKLRKRFDHLGDAVEVEVEVCGESGGAHG